MKGDRILGLACLVVALAYIASATQIRTSFLVDPMGPKAFPIIIGAIMALSSLVLIFQPETDPAWPSGSKTMKMGIALVILISYALALDTMGFIVPTALASGLVSYQIKADARAAAVIGVVLSVGLFIIFKLLLGLGLSAWPDFLIR